MSKEFRREYVKKQLKGGSAVLSGISKESGKETLEMNIATDRRPTTLELLTFQLPKIEYKGTGALDVAMSRLRNLERRPEVRRGPRIDTSNMSFDLELGKSYSS